MDRRELIISNAEHIVNKYKNAFIEKKDIDLSRDNDYLTLKPINLYGRNMPYAAKKILKRFPEIRYVHFTGGWVENVYSRETLRWGGMWN